MLLASVFIAGAVAAKSTAWKDSGRADDRDWTNDSNFTEGAPASGDTVSVPSTTIYAANGVAGVIKQYKLVISSHAGKKEEPEPEPNTESAAQG